MTEQEIKLDLFNIAKRAMMAHKCVTVQSSDSIVKSILDKYDLTPKEKPFPKPMKRKDSLIVYFRSAKAGIGIGSVIKADEQNLYDICDTCDNWLMSSFEDCEIKITIKP